MRTNVFSKKCFFEALLRLYHQKPYSEIQISELCREAGYNRSTFYRIYPSKEALLLDGFREEYMMGYYRSIPPAAAETRAVFTRNVELLFAFIRKNPDFFLMMRDEGRARVLHPECSRGRLSFHHLRLAGRRDGAKRPAHGGAGGRGHGRRPRAVGRRTQR